MDNSEVPTIKKTIGVQHLNGLASIRNLNFYVDMGNNGYLNYPVYINATNLKLKFSYYNPKTGNAIYREIEEK